MSRSSRTRAKVICLPGDLACDVFKSGKVRRRRLWVVGVGVGAFGCGCKLAHLKLGTSRVDHVSEYRDGEDRRVGEDMKRFELAQKQAYQAALGRKEDHA